MSDYDTATDHSDDDVVVPKNVKVKYTTDGLNETDYRRSDVAHEDLVKAECCHIYFKPEAYVHQTQYKLSVQGINMCIHCYIGFNLHKFGKCDGLTKQEEDCLRYYIEKFTNDHCLNTCNKSKIYGKCMLCESKIGIKPKVCKKNDVLEVVESNFGMSGQPTVTTADIVLINKSSTSEFVLVL